MTELGVLCVSSALVVGFYVAMARLSDAREPEPIATLIGAVFMGFLAYRLTLLADLLAFPAAVSATLHYAAETCVEALGALIVAGLSGRLRGRRGSEIDGALDGVLYLGLVALGVGLSESLRFALRGATWMASLGLFQHALLVSLGRLSLTVFAGMGLGLAAEHAGLGRKAAIFGCGVLASVGMASLLGLVEPTMSLRPWWPMVLALLASGWFVALALLARREKLQRSTT